MAEETPLYTIGYGARDLAAFIVTLHENQIQFLLDVRSKPYSRFKPEFSKESLQSALEASGIRYLFIGDALGGQPDDETCYTDGKVDYAKLGEKSFYREGINRLHKASQQGLRVALMCSEGKPENCHRSKLIGRTLAQQGLEVLHIDEQDELISQHQVMLRLTGGQMNLFGDEFGKLTSRKRYREE